MRVAFVGKGGAGKSTIAGTFARLLARPRPAGAGARLRSHAGAALLPRRRRGRLSHPRRRGGRGSPRRAPVGLATRPGRGRHREPPRGAVPRRACATCSSGTCGAPSSGSRRRSMPGARSSRSSTGTSWHLVGDLPGGTRQAMFGWARYADTVCVVVEPTVKSLHTRQTAAHPLGGSMGRRRGCCWSSTRPVTATTRPASASGWAWRARRSGSPRSRRGPGATAGGRRRWTSPRKAPWPGRSDGLVDHVGSLYGRNEEVVQ